MSPLEWIHLCVALATFLPNSVYEVTLGIDISSLYEWKRQLSTDGAEAFRGNGNRTGLEEENRELRLEVRRLREETEILKKAAAYFAKHQR